MAKQVTDEEASLKRQARRRLIGAVALVTAVAVILPMVLDSEPKPAGVDIELRIPDKDKVAAFQPQQAPVVAAAPQPVAEPVVVEPAASAVAPVAEQVPVVTTAKPEPKTAKAEVQPVAKQDAKPATKPEAKSESKAEVKPEPKAKPESKAAEVKSEAKTSSKAETPPPAKADSADGKPSFVLQIGAYSNPEIAKDWQAKLKKQGFHAYTEAAGARTRLRVGPFSSREAAEKVRQKLVALELHPDVLDLGSK